MPVSNVVCFEVNSKSDSVCRIAIKNKMMEQHKLSHDARMLSVFMCQHFILERKIKNKQLWKKNSLVFHFFPVPAIPKCRLEGRALIILLFCTSSFAAFPVPAIKQECSQWGDLCFSARTLCRPTGPLAEVHLVQCCVGTGRVWPRWKRGFSGQGESSMEQIGPVKEQDWQRPPAYPNTLSQASWYYTGLHQATI